jgi:hypothetical protein
MARNGGGVSILKRLMQQAPRDIAITIAYDVTANPGITPVEGEKSFFTLPRNFRFGIGKLIGRCTILGLDFIAARSLRKLIKKENPDVIHLVAHGVCFPATARAALKSGKKIVVSVHDTWSWTVSPFISSSLADRIFKSIINKAATVYVISKEMEEYLRETCGDKNYQVIHDGIVQQLPSANNETALKKLSLLYVGLLHHMQEKLFNLLVEAMGEITHQQFAIGICSNTTFMPMQVPANVTIVNHGWQTEEQMKVLSAGYQFGLLPLSFEPEDELFYRTSLMTKIPFYTGVLLPVICIGPASASSVKFVQRHQTGIVCTSGKHEDLVVLLEKISKEFPSMYQKYIYHLKESAATVFNIQTISKRFYENLPGNCIHPENAKEYFEEAQQ